MILEFGRVYEVMRRNGKYNWCLGMARADIVDGQEVLVGSYDWKTKEPVTFAQIHNTELTGKVFTDEELVGTGFQLMFGGGEMNKELKEKYSLATWRAVLKLDEGSE